MWVKAVNPENRIIDSIANAVGPVVLRKLHEPAEAERAQRCIIKDGGTADIRDTDTCMIDHCDILRIANGPVFEQVSASAAAWRDSCGPLYPLSGSR
jgi:hypothetical protein